MLPALAKSYVLGPVKLAVKIALVVGVLLVAGLIWLSIAVDLNAYKPQIEEQATAAMGKPVTVGGDINWGISWLRPSLDINDIRIGAGKTSATTVGRVSVVVPLLDLISGGVAQWGIPAQMKLALEALVYEGQVIGDITAPVSYRGGNLSIDPLTVKLPHDGEISAVVHYQDNQLSVDAVIDDVDYALIIPGASGGDIGGTLKLQGRGTTVDAVLTGLNGEVALAGGKGKLSGDAISLWASDVLSKILTGTQSHTNVTCLLLDGSIRNGVLTPSQAVLDTESVLVRATGRIDLGRQRLQLLVTPSPKDPALLSLATPVNVTGAWDNPSVTPDKRAVLEKVGGLVLGAVAPPAALLAFGSTGDKSSPCKGAQP